MYLFNILCAANKNGYNSRNPWNYEYFSVHVCSKNVIQLTHTKNLKK